MSDTAIIGAGHNGLVCACYLAREGHKVTVYEQAPIPGGCTTTEVMYPEFSYNIGAIELEGMVHSGIIDELDLAGAGLEMIRPTHLLSAWVGDDALHLKREKTAALERLATDLGTEASREWEAFSRYSDAVMSLLGTFQHVKAPDTGGLGHIMVRLGQLGEENERILQTLFSPSVTVLDEFLKHPLLKAASLAYSTHPQLPPWLPGTGPLASLLASSHGGAGARPRGGTGKLIEALVKRLESYGGVVRCEAPVEKILTSGGRVEGLELKDGEKVTAGRVVSTLDIKRVAGWLGDAVPSGLERAAARAHCGLYNVGEIKLDIALDGPPSFINDTSEDAGALKYLMHRVNSYVQSFKDIIAGLFPEDPPLMVGVPSIDDPSMAPPGKAVLWVSSFVPATLRDGLTWPEANAEAAERVLASFERFAPGTRAKILHTEITGPHEWEVRTGNPAGNPNHIDMTMDQCFSFRPGIGLDQYTTPVEGLYLSGAGTHPGGGVHGMPGKLAAQAIHSGGKPVKRKGPSLVLLAKNYFQLKKALR